MKKLCILIYSVKSLFDHSLKKLVLKIKSMWFYNIFYYRVE